MIFVALEISAQDNLEITEFLKGTTVYDICSFEDEIWVATNGNGIFKYSTKTKKWQNFSTANKEVTLDFFHCIEANNKFVWAGSTDGLYIYDRRRKKFTKRKFGKGGQLSNWIRSLKYDKYEDILWIGRFKYLTKLDLKKRRFTDYDLTTDNDEKTNTIKTIAADGDSLMWFGTEAGLHKYDKSRDLDSPGTIALYDNRLNYFNGEGDEVSISAIVFEQNNMWIGLDEFITKYNPDYNLGGLFNYNRQNEWIRFDSQKGLRGNGIYDIELVGNYIWVASYQFSQNTKDQYGRGLALINRITEEVSVLTNEKLPDTVFSLHFDGKQMWIGAKDGLYMIDLQNAFVENFYKGK